MFLHILVIDQINCKNNNPVQSSTNNLETQLNYKLICFDVDIF